MIYWELTVSTKDDKITVRCKVPQLWAHDYPLLGIKMVLARAVSASPCRLRNFQCAWMEFIRLSLIYQCILTVMMKSKREKSWQAIIFHNDHIYNSTIYIIFIPHSTEPFRKYFHNIVDRFQNIFEIS